MRRSLERLLLALLGAVLGGIGVCAVEASTALDAAGGRGASWPALWLADAGVLGPLIVTVGAAVAAASLFLEPRAVTSPVERFAVMRSGPAFSRAGVAALVPLAIVACCVWLVATAQAARSLLARGNPAASGFALAVGSGVLLVALVGAVLAALPGARAWLTSAALRWPRVLDPLVTGAAGLAAGALVIGCGIAVGDTGGDGPTPVAIFGVLKRQELDLRPVGDLLFVAACAWASTVLLRPRWVPEADVGRSWPPVAASSSSPRPARRVLVASIASVAAVAGLLALTAYEARALEADPAVARILDSHAPLGRIGLALDRRATDRDHDGASPYFGGGDCDDTNPAISPLAVDIPGNGVDEDCSGSDEPAGPADAPGVAAASTHKPGHPPAIARDFNLIFITVDTLRATETGFLGYDKPTTPNLDKLAAKSVVFERAYAMASYTGKALAPMLIGKYPSETLRDGGHFNKYFAGNTFLAERLRAAGIFTMGAASHWYFRETWGLEQGSEVFDLSAMPTSGQSDTDTNSTSPQLTDAAIRLLGAHAASRFFLWVHYFDPHAQYVPHEGAPDFADPRRPPGWKMRALYDGEVWFTDRAIGRLLDYVDGQPWGKDTVVVLTADHGESMGEHGIAFQHGFEVWEGLMRVPLLMRVPGAVPHRVPVKRSVIDLVPTVLDLMRVPAPAPGQLSGQSAAADVFAKAGDAFEERDVYIDMPDGPYTHMRRALIHGTTPGMKLIHFGGRQYQLYNLATDPEEQDDLSTNPALLGPMVQAIRAKRSTLKEISVKPEGASAP